MSFLVIGLSLAVLLAVGIWGWRSTKKGVTGNGAEGSNPFPIVGPHDGGSSDHVDAVSQASDFGGGDSGGGDGGGGGGD